MSEQQDHLPTEEIQHSLEAQKAGFQSYREACDSTSKLCRKQGIFLEEDYRASVSDERTIVVEARGGLQIPVATPTELVPGLNHDFFAKKFPEGAMYVNPLLIERVDFPDIAKHVAEAVATNKSSVFYEFSMEQDYGTREFVSLVAEDLRAMGFELEYDEIEDPEVDDEHAAYKPAAMILYEGNVMHREARAIHPEEDVASEGSLSDYFWQGAEAGEIPADKEIGSVIYSGKQVSESEGLVDELWDIYKDRFSELGANYPISLEDSFEEFVEMLTSPDTMTAIAFADSKVACFTFLVKDVKTAFWLNDKSLSEQYSGDMPYYFPGIVAHRDRSGHAAEVLFAIGRTAKYAKLDFKILYDHSAQTVPLINNSFRSTRGG